MADIVVTCASCGKTVTISEFAAETAACGTCGGTFRKARSEQEGSEDAAAPPPRLSVLRRGAGEGVTLRGEAVAPKPSFEHAERVIPNASAEEEQKRHRTPGRVLGPVVLLLASAVLVGPQILSDRYPDLLAVYIQVRLYAMAAIWIAVCVEAWREGAARGIFATLFPPYVFVYTFGRVDRVWLRSLVVAVALMLAAELHYLGPQALIRQGQASIDQGMLNVENLLQRASGPLDRR